MGSLKNSIAVSLVLLVLLVYEFDGAGVILSPSHTITKVFETAIRARVNYLLP